MTWLRRVVTVPLLTALMVGILVSGPLLFGRRRISGTGSTVEPAGPYRGRHGLRVHRIANPGEAGVR
jgi:hypothetical protein